MLDLPDVTLVAVFTVAHDVERAAVADCLAKVRFGDVQVYTDRPLNGEVRCGPFVDGELEHFVARDIPPRIRTSHTLFVQWDGWVVNPSAWRAEFLEYDYVGAPWWYRDGMNVGNSGFSLRSERLMDFLARNSGEYPYGSPFDHVLCRVQRPQLEQQHGFSWAPSDLAWRFSFERTARYPTAEVFGFHGVFNWVHVLSLDQIVERVEKMDDYVRSKPEFGELTALVVNRWGEVPWVR